MGMGGVSLGVFFVLCFASNADVVQADDVYKLQSSLMLMYDWKNTLK